MKKLFLLATVILIGLTAFPQSVPNSPAAVAAGKNVKVNYNRPPKGGREIFGRLVPFGQIWRCGANSATTISFTKDGLIGGRPVKKGTYSLFAIPQEKQWTIILNSQPGLWGAYEYDKYKDKNVAQVLVPVNHLDKVVERLTIRFSPENSMIIEWDQTQVSVPVKI